MSQRTTPRQSTLRTRAAILAAGLGVTTALGAGVAFAANSSGDAGAPRAAAAVAADKAAHSEKATVAKAKDKDKKAKTAKNPTWAKPVSKYTLSATYGRGGGMWASKHSGQDFAVSVGTNVKAVHAGTVVKAGPNGAGDGPAYGNAIVIKHGTGPSAKYSQYAHLSKVKVHAGQKVDKGQSVALSGNTGNSSGPHLHFEIRTTPNYGSAINPVSFLRAADVIL
ncbi:M23 family metallopeptidase [Streptomyces sp. NP-1717]|uniref:M23 family metallopeptidase n=1 Tax=unclassified Streptomyces TaxID=2593676 RepID=UPI001F5D1EA7|nr:M23 family metallopeptidase [Streptomyces sp. NP-1717]MCI3224817.1 M23 family metallopeptidase [Streptomyces sp. NP-1717]WTA75019.1 M23 family metallopeptidase [Streptomyces sp. NBC_00838]